MVIIVSVHVYVRARVVFLCRDTGVVLGEGGGAEGGEGANVFLGWWGTFGVHRVHRKKTVGGGFVSYPIMRAQGLLYEYAFL